MKRMKKLLAVLLTAIMVMSMGTSVFAASGSASITITGVATANHTFSAYQIFDGDVSSGTMSNVVWGDGITDTSGFITALLADATIGSYFSSASITTSSTAAEVAKVVADNNSISGFVTAFAAVAVNYVSTTSGSVTYEAQSDGTYDYTISNLDDGYYLVTDSTSSGSTDTDAVSNYIVQVLTGTTTSIASKNQIPTVTKTIGSSEKGTSLSAGDTVSFTLTGTVPSEAANYTTYAYTFKDTLSSNLEYTTNTVAVTVDGTTVDSSEYSVDYTSNVLTISFTDVKAYAGKSIVVTYDATLSASNTTSKAETNTVVVEYSNNPNRTGDTGTTVESKVYVYSFDLTVNKEDGDGDGLAGAEFTLYKSVSLSSADEMVSGKKYVDSSFETTTNYDEAAYVVIGTSEATSSTNSYAVTFGNLEEGDYVLVESKTPDGYNTAANTSFTIEATYDSDGQITRLINSGTVTASGTTGYTVTIQNLSGSSLPVTGGMGTTILYIIGGILVAGAAVLLVTRRRMAR